MVIFFFLVFAFFTSLYPAAIGLTAVPIALSQAHWSYRLAGLYVSAVLLGIVPILLSLAPGLGFAFLFGLMCLVAATARTLEFLQIGMAAIGAITIFVVLLIAPWTHADLNWFVRGTLVAASVSVVALLIRIAGFRLIRVTEVADARTWHAATGYDLDEWLIRFDRQMGLAKSRDEMQTELRRSGLDAHWSKEIANTYLRCIGRFPIARTRDGQKIYARRGRRRRLLDSTMHHLRGARYSIWQMMVWTLAVAATLGFLRLIAGRFPTDRDLSLGPAMIGMVASTSLTAAIIGLSLPPRRRIVFRCLLTLAAFVGTAAMTMQLLQFGSVYVLPVTGVMLMTWAVQLVGFTLMRQRGYRLIQIEPRRREVSLFNKTVTRMTQPRYSN